MLRRSRARKQERATAAAETRSATLEQLEKLPKLRGKYRRGPKEKSSRKVITDRVLIEAILLNFNIVCPCGCGTRITALEGTIREHTWALENRPKNPDGTVTPDANDPNHIGLWLAGHDKQKTFGPGGTKRITTKGGDNHTREHREKVSESEQKFRDRMAAKGKPIVPRRIG